MGNSRLSCSAVRVLLLAAALVLPTTRAAIGLTTCATVCPGSGPCEITTNVDVDPGSLIDCSGRDLRIKNLNGKLSVDEGSFTLRAHDLRVDTSHRIEATGFESGFQLELTGQLDLYGQLRADHAEGDSRIVIEAAGDIIVHPSASGGKGIVVSATATEANGGEIALRSGGAVVVNSPLHADGHIAGSSVSGGGHISITAADNITISNKVSADGRETDAGRIDLRAGGNVVVTQVTGGLFAEGYKSDGSGGEIHLGADGAITLGDRISVRGGRNGGDGTSAGGSVVLESGCGGAAVNANIDARGGELGSGLQGGAITVRTLGALAVAPNVVLQASSTDNGGDGGAVTLVGGAATTIGQGVVIEAKGHNGDPDEEGRGASVQIEGCTVDLAASVVIDATGFEGGEVVVRARALPPLGSVPQPLRIDELALVSVGGDTPTDDGTVDLVGRAVKSGCCDNQQGCVACTLDIDCTAGCNAGDCLYANPDTGGITTQFDVAPETNDDVSLLPCEAVCQ